MPWWFQWMLIFWWSPSDVDCLGSWLASSNWRWHHPQTEERLKRRCDARHGGGQRMPGSVKLGEIAKVLLHLGEWSSMHRDSHDGMYHHTSTAIPRVASRLRLHLNENITTNCAEEVWVPVTSVEISRLSVCSAYILALLLIFFSTYDGSPEGQGMFMGTHQVSYPLVMTNIAMENGPFIDGLPIKMVIFNSYVSLPEGIPYSSWMKPRIAAVFMFTRGPRPDPQTFYENFARPLSWWGGASGSPVEPVDTNQKENQRSYDFLETTCFNANNLWDQMTGRWLAEDWQMTGRWLADDWQMTGRWLARGTLGSCSIVAGASFPARRAESQCLEPTGKSSLVGWTSWRILVNNPGEPKFWPTCHIAKIITLWLLNIAMENHHF